MEDQTSVGWQNCQENCQVKIPCDFKVLRPYTPLMEMVKLESYRANGELQGTSNDCEAAQGERCAPYGRASYFDTTPIGPQTAALS
jgi:hypothetical protein